MHKHPCILGMPTTCSFKQLNTFGSEISPAELLVDQANRVEEIRTELIARQRLAEVLSKSHFLCDAKCLGRIVHFCDQEPGEIIANQNLTLRSAIELRV